jgi:type IV fimbrial biogenesis protein FimT
MTRAPALADRGFSLIELAFALVLAAVLAALAMPSFATYMQNVQIRTAAEALLNGVQLARAEAVRRNTAVEFVLGTNTGWTVSTVAGEELQTRSEDDGSPNAQVVVTPGGATRLTFNGFGRVLNPNPDASAPISQIEINNPAGGTCTAASGRMRCLQVRVTTGGNVRLCDPTYAAGDPRGC